MTLPNPLPTTLPHPIPTTLLHINPTTLQLQPVPARSKEDFISTFYNSTVEEILRFMQKKDIKIAAFQEAFFDSKTELTDVPKFTFVRRDRPDNSGWGGVAYLVHESLLPRSHGL